jgi:hypothetical protein
MIDADKLASREVPLEDGSSSSYLGNQVVTWRQRQCTESQAAFLATTAEMSCNSGSTLDMCTRVEAKILYWGRGRCYHLFQS